MRVRYTLRYNLQDEKAILVTYLEPERGMGLGIAVNAPSSTKLTSVLLVASNSGEHPHVTAVASDWPFLDLAYFITFAPL